jgi:protein adenylyltransferase
VTWRTRLAREPVTPAQRAGAMRRVNPAYIPRNHRVEAALVAAQQNSDFVPFEELLAVLANPFDDQPQYAHYQDPPNPEEVVHQTFCGT